jgi:DNA-binding transcriptional ArsR family regulator
MLHVEQTRNKENRRGLLTPVGDQFITISFYNTSVMQMTPSDQLDATFVALADPTRRAILVRLMQGEASVNELAEPFEISQPAISKHLKILERAGLVTRSAAGTRRPVKIEAAPMKDAVDWLEKYRKFWEASYARLDALLAELQTPLNTDKPAKKKDAKDA